MTTTFLPLLLTIASPAVDHLMHVASTLPNHSSDFNFVSCRYCAIIGTPRNGRPSTSRAISVPLSANASVSACATGFTPPAVLPPSQITASEIPRGWTLERFSTESRYLNTSPLCSSWAILRRSSLSVMSRGLRLFGAVPAEGQHYTRLTRSPSGCVLARYVHLFFRTA